jgi:hypothetical protein
MLRNVLRGPKEERIVHVKGFVGKGQKARESQKREKQHWMA